MKNPMIRGDAAPMGFAQSVGSWLRAYAYRERNKRGSIGQIRRAQLIDAASSLPMVVGDDDPRIRTLALAAEGTRWEPTGHQLAVVQGAAHRVAGEPHELDPDDLLNALAHAAILDMETTASQRLSHLRKTPDLPAGHDVILGYERDRADVAERRVRELELEKATLAADYSREHTHRRELQAIVNGEPIAAEQVPARDPKALPEGIRKKGSGYQAYFKIGDRTSSRICPTVDEAVRWRTDAMARARGEIAASDANLNPKTDPDLTSEQMAELREKAAA